MLNFKFDFTEDVRCKNELDFELGYISVIFNNEILYDGKKKQNYMLFVSICDILLGLTEYVKKNMKKKEVGLADSSVTFSFIRDKYRTSLEINKELVCEVETDLIINEFFEAANEFYRMYSSKMGNAVDFDMKYAIDKISSMMN